MAAKRPESEREARRRETVARRRAERRAGRSEAARGARPLPNWELLVPASLGMLLAGYLALVAIRGTTAIACGVGSDCDVVQSSRFATVAGVPVAVWGFAAYALLAGVAAGVRSRWWHAWTALAVSGPALATSLYLTAVSLFHLDAACPWCLASLGLVTACFVAAVRAAPEPIQELPRGRLVAGGVACLAVVAGLHLHFHDVLMAGPEDPWLRGLARHLSESDAVFYGASWCTHCADQKEAFGASAFRLPYVECSPRGRRAAQAEACRDAGVDAYPTWIVEGERFEGILEPDRLAELTGFRPLEAGSS